MVGTQTFSGSMSGCWVAVGQAQVIEAQPVAAPRCGVCRRMLGGFRTTVKAFVAVLAVTGLVGLAISGLLPVVLIAACLLLPALAPALLLVLGLLAPQGVNEQR
jgi:hypothetical protein